MYSSDSPFLQCEARKLPAGTRLTSWMLEAVHVDRERSCYVERECTYHLNRKDEGSANVALVYLLLMLGFFTWLLFDTWINAHTLFHVVGYATDKLTLLETSIYHLVAYTVIGGAIGGIVNGIRSVLLYYSNFQRRYF